MLTDTRQLVDEARQTLGLTQRELALRLGSSIRTGVRWSAGQSDPSIAQLRALAEMVYPLAPELAARLALVTATTLEEMGILRPPPPEPPAPAPSTEPPRPMAALVDAIVCAAAEAMDVSPRAVRPAVLAAFARAKELGISVDAAHDVLGTRTRSPR